MEWTWRSPASVCWAADRAWPSTWPPKTYLVPMSRLWPRNRLSSRRSRRSRSTSSAATEAVMGTPGFGRRLYPPGRARQGSGPDAFERHRVEHLRPGETWTGVAFSEDLLVKIVAGRDLAEV